MPSFVDHYQWPSSLDRVHGTACKEIMARVLQGHQETHVLRIHLCRWYDSPLALKLILALEKHQA
jgi:hypothetical protein